MADAIAEYLNHVTSAHEVKRHVRDAAIAMQVPWPRTALTPEDWLEKCAKVQQARDKLTRAHDT